MNFLEVNAIRMASVCPDVVPRFDRMAIGAEKENRCVTTHATIAGNVYVFDFKGEEDTAKEALERYVSQGIPKACFRVLQKCPPSFDSGGAAVGQVMR